MHPWGSYGLNILEFLIPLTAMGPRQNLRIAAKVAELTKIGQAPAARQTEVDTARLIAKLDELARIVGGS
eukprot:3080463-Amphidinium_carterae.1